MGSARYNEIADDLLRRIEDKEWKAGETLPPMEQLAQHYQVSRNVIARAVQKLAQAGRLVSVPRRGTVVRPEHRKVIIRTDLVRRNTRHVRDGQEIAGGYSFPAAMGNELWIDHGKRDISEQPVEDARLAHMLNVPVGAPALRRLRVTGPPGEPAFQISATWIHPRIVQEVPEVKDPHGTGPGAWIDAIESAGHGPLEWMERKRVRMPTQAETRLLLIPADLPVWEIVRLSYSAKDEKVVDVTQVIIPGDRIEEISKLRREGAATWPHTSDGPDGPPVAPRDV
ncbi:GntR family transcriptional regulator [Actinomadura parmotrematis]|uniref:GntR family transcriptional regulator n=1 Tax=Actinomadura parmotrematis TaxID=2864039 RepID=A0ABS7G1X2_9ACTN|nr:GntR family transcriptional regulator [Actinomadura parmotrematis]MBW8486712.1 GntR family transcriptional regulator [Actinomadura parmotrematis]